MFKHRFSALCFAVALCLATMVLTGCADDSTGSSSRQAFTFDELLLNITDNIILPNYNSAAKKSSLLTSAVSNYCSAINTGNEGIFLSAAQIAWQNLMADIQTTELHVLGPITFDNALLRSRIYSFYAGALNTCGTDQGVVRARTTTDFDINTRAITQKGAGAIEYILFNSDLNFSNNCNIPEADTWNNFSSTERKTARCEYAAIVAENIQQSIDAVVSAWHIDEGNYRSIFLNPDNVASSVSALSDALFFLDIDLKDNKLGIPMGINNNCNNIACPEQVESPYSQHSLTHIDNNLESFLQIFNGANGLGFDDLIIHSGFTDITIKFQDNINNAIAQTRSINSSLFAQATALDNNEKAADCINAANNPENSSNQSACTLFGLVKRINDDLKSDFVTIVNVDLPDRAQSDND